MRKIVINTCFGGFRLSDAGIRKYAELKGLTLYPETGRYGMPTYWLVPIDEARTKPLASRAHFDAIFNDRNIARDDPYLVQTVELLGAAANGPHAVLKIVEIPDDIAWEIRDYDGKEHVAEKRSTWS